MAFTHGYMQQFCDQAKKLQEARSIPNFVLSIVHPAGNVVVASGPKIDEQTLFPIGSMSKAFAATLIGILVDKGLIDWNDSIYKFIDIKMPDDVDLTLSQLLRHINPFPEHALTEASEFGFSRQQLLRKLQYIKIGQSFKFSYQNVLFSLISDIVEKVTGKHYEECLRQEIFIPLGMSSTTAEEKAYLAYANKASPHIKHGDKINTVPYSPYWHIMGPPSCVSSSIADLTRWLKFNLQMGYCSLRSKCSLSVIQFPLKESHPPYAMGWWQADEEGLVLCHTGSVTGFESAIAIIPSCDIGITVCANLSGDNFTRELVNDFIKYVLNKKIFNCMDVLKLQMPITRPKLKLDKFVGVFYHPILENIKVSYKNEVLFLEIGKNQTLATLSPISLLASHSKMPSELAQLAPHHCFQINWQSGMEAAGKLYYDADKVAFVENQNGDIDSVFLFAEAISNSPLNFKNITDDKAIIVGKELNRFFKPSTSLKPTVKKESSNKKWWIGVGFFAIGVAGALIYRNTNNFSRMKFSL